MSWGSSIPRCCCASAVPAPVIIHLLNRRRDTVIDSGGWSPSTSGNGRKSGFAWRGAAPDAGADGPARPGGTRDGPAVLGARLGGIGRTIRSDGRIGTRSRMPRRATWCS